MIGKVLLLVCAALCLAQAASIKWTGLEANNQWTSRINWSPAQVPGPDDDVTIETGNVEVTISTGVKSLMMGTSVVSPANLTLFQSFSVGGQMTVQANGNLIMNAGTAALTGQVEIDGNFIYASGTLGGMITVTSRGKLDMSGAGSKNLIGVALTNQGTATVGGVVVFNQSSVFTNAATLQSDDNMQLMAEDKTQTLFDSSKGSIAYNGGSNTFRLMVAAKIGAITISSGTVDVFSTVNFADDIVVPAGSSISTSGSAVVTFGGNISGTGTISASSAVASFQGVNITGVNVNGGVAVFNAKAAAERLMLTGGTLDVESSEVGASRLTILGGVLNGTGILTGANVTIESKGFNIEAGLRAETSLSFSAKTLLSFSGKTAELVLGAVGAGDIVSPLTLTGPPGTLGLRNEGTISVHASIQTTNVDLTGTGTYKVSGSVSANTASVTVANFQLNGGSVSGSNTNLDVAAVSAASNGVSVTIGQYNLECPTQCTNIKESSSTTSFKFANQQ